MASRMLNWGGPAALVGGVLWIIVTIVTALHPEGCIIEACDLPGSSLREGTALDGLLAIAALFSLACGLAALVARVRAAGQFGKLGQISTTAIVAGGAVLVAGGLAQALHFGIDVPYFVVGVLALIVGTLVLGVVILRAAVLPRWVGLLLVIGALALLPANYENARVLLGIPFGLAWAAVGYALWSADAKHRTRGAGWGASSSRSQSRSGN
jgi:hypothetical protein